MNQNKLFNEREEAMRKPRTVLSFKEKSVVIKALKKRVREKTARFSSLPEATAAIAMETGIQMSTANLVGCLKDAEIDNSKISSYGESRPQRKTVSAGKVSELEERIAALEERLSRVEDLLK